MPNIYRIRCGACDMYLSSRGTKGYLISQKKIAVFGIDNIDVLKTTEDYDASNEKFLLCNCRIRWLKCIKCSNLVGYTLCQVCETCKQHWDGKRYVFPEGPVKGRLCINAVNGKPVYSTELPIIKKKS
mmetsp:Transcript_3478/g.5118  ORF Transcript_3478/g.5118 Transcript_3478/m.5118 type:complete len:128 (-) Transcript_3478:134-517(-)